MWIPLMMQPALDAASLLGDPHVGWLRVMGRMHASVPADQRDPSALSLALARLRSQEGGVGDASRHIASIEVTESRYGIAGSRERLSVALRLLAGIVAIFLLVACANVATLLLARGATRQREFTIRFALGAGRARLIGQFLAEGTLFGAAGVVIGLGGAWFLSRALLVLLSPDGTPIPVDVTPGPRLALFAVLLVLIAVLLFALVPAFAASRGEVALLRRRGPSAGDRPRLTSVLVVSQVALSVLLVAGSALLLRTLHNLRTRDLGFAPDSLLQVEIDIAASSDEVSVLSRSVVERLSGLPGVAAVTAAEAGFGTGVARTCCVAIQGREHQPGEDREIQTIGVAPDYFRVLRLPLLYGRPFDPSDATSDPRRTPVRAVIVNEAFVRRFLSEGNAIGRRIGWGNPPRVTYEYEVVGVANNVLDGDLRAAPRPTRYYPTFRGTVFSVRTRDAPADSRAAVLAALHAHDPDLDVTGSAVVSAEVERSLHRERLLATLATAFGVLAAAMALIGVYGLAALAATARTREIGIRMALGEDRTLVGLRALWSAVRLGGVGVLIGIPAAAAAGWIARSQMFGVSPADPLTMAATAGAVLLVCGVAAFIPARRASRVDPVVALRGD